MHFKLLLNKSLCQYVGSRYFFQYVITSALCCVLIIARLKCAIVSIPATNYRQPTAPEFATQLRLTQRIALMYPVRGFPSAQAFSQNTLCNFLYGVELCRYVLYDAMALTFKKHNLQYQASTVRAKGVFLKERRTDGSLLFAPNYQTDVHKIQLGLLIFGIPESRIRGPVISPPRFRAEYSGLDFIQTAVMHSINANLTKITLEELNSSQDYIEADEIRTAYWSVLTGFVGLAVYISSNDLINSYQNEVMNKKARILESFGCPRWKNNISWLVLSCILSSIHVLVLGMVVPSYSVLNLVLNFDLRKPKALGLGILGVLIANVMYAVIACNIAFLLSSNFGSFGAFISFAFHFIQFFPVIYLTMTTKLCIVFGRVILMLFSPMVQHLVLVHESLALPATKDTMFRSFNSCTGFDFLAAEYCLPMQLFWLIVLPSTNYYFCKQDQYLCDSLYDESDSEEVKQCSCQNITDPSNRIAQSSEENEVLLQFTNVSAKMYDEPVIQDFNFSLGNRGVHCLLTYSKPIRICVANILGGCIGCYEGTISFKHESLKEGSSIFDMIAVCPSENTLFSDITLFENLTLIASSTPRDVCAGIERIIDEAGMPEHLFTKLRDLNPSVRRKIDLSFVFGKKCPLVVIDEPLIGVNTFDRNIILNQIHRQSKDRSLFLLTGQPEIAELISHYILVATASGHLVLKGKLLTISTQLKRFYCLSLYKRNDCLTYKVLQRIEQTIPCLFSLMGDDSEKIVIQIMDIEENELLKLIELFEAPQTLHHYKLFSYGISKVSLTDLLLQVGSEKEKDDNARDMLDIEMIHKSMCSRKSGFVDDCMAQMCLVWYLMTNSMSVFNAILALIFFILNNCISFMPLISETHPISLTEPLRGTVCIIYSTKFNYKTLAFLDYLYTVLRKGGTTIKFVSTSERACDMFVRIIETPGKVKFQIGPATAFYESYDYLIMKQLIYNSYNVFTGGKSVFMFFVSVLENAYVNLGLRAFIQMVMMVSAHSLVIVLGCIFSQDYFTSLQLMVARKPLMKLGMPKVAFWLISAAALTVRGYLTIIFVHFTFRRLMVYFALENDSHVKRDSALMPVYVRIYLGAMWMITAEYVLWLMLLMLLATRIVAIKKDWNRIYQMVISSVVCNMIVQFSYSYLGNVPAFFLTKFIGIVTPGFKGVEVTSRLVYQHIVNTYCNVERVTEACDQEPWQVTQCCEHSLQSSIGLTWHENYLHITMGIGETLIWTGILMSSQILCICIIEYMWSRESEGFTMTSASMQGISCEDVTKTNCYADETIAAEVTNVFKVSEQKLAAKQGITFKNVALGVGSDFVLFGFTLRIPSGSCVGIVGMESCGKTLILNMLRGDVRVSSGTLFMDGEVLQRGSKQNRKSIGFYEENGAEVFEITMERYLYVICLLRGVASNDAETQISLLIKAFELQSFVGRIQKSLTPSEQNVVAVAAAFAGYPKYVLLDEPTKNVDPENRKQLWAGVSFMRELGLTIVITSKSVTVCDRMKCDRIAIVIHGQLASIRDCSGMLQYLSCGYMFIVELQPDENIRGDVVHPGSQQQNEVDTREMILVQFVLSSLPDSMLYSKLGGRYFEFLSGTKTKCSDLFALRKRLTTVMQGDFLSLNISKVSEEQQLESYVCRKIKEVYKLKKRPIAQSNAFNEFCLMNHNDQEF